MSEHLLIDDPDFGRRFLQFGWKLQIDRYKWTLRKRNIRLTVHQNSSDIELIVEW